MAYTAHYGTIATTNNSDFRIVLYTEEPVYNATNYTIQYYWAIEVTRGNFQNSILDSSYSGNWSITLNGVGITAQSSVYTKTVNYGDTATFSGWASYTGGSGAFYKSTIEYVHEEYPTMFVHDGSKWRRAIIWVYDGSKWRRAIHKVYNGSKWVSGS